MEFRFSACFRLGKPIIFAQHLTKFPFFSPKHWPKIHLLYPESTYWWRKCDHIMILSALNWKETRIWTLLFEYHLSTDWGKNENVTGGGDTGNLSIWCAYKLHINWINCDRVWFYFYYMNCRPTLLGNKSCIFHLSFPM